MTPLTGTGRPAVRALSASALIVTAAALAPAVLSSTALLNVQSAIGLALFACATNLLIGYGGLVSFGQGAFYGIGAYTVALAWLHLHTSFWVSLVCAPVVGAVAALAVGLLALRTRRMYFALLTLAVSQLLYVVVHQQIQFTGGANGVFGAILPGFLLDPDHAFWFTLAVAIVGLLVLWQVTRSPFGLTLRAIRENRERAEALGVNVFRHQLAAFAISGALCSLAGVLFVVYDQSANPDLLNWTESGYPILMAVLGGQFTFLGPALGALIYEQARDVLLVNFSDSQLVFGLVLLVIMLAAPDGLTGVLGRAGRAAAGRWRSLASPRSGGRPGGDQAGPDGEADPHEAVARR
ncbi:MAG: branched-chain amino acid ABC transporter permease [Trebonia sp.]